MLRRLLTLQLQVQFSYPWRADAQFRQESQYFSHMFLVKKNKMLIRSRAAFCRTLDLYIVKFFLKCVYISTLHNISQNFYNGTLISE